MKTMSQDMALAFGLIMLAVGGIAFAFNCVESPGQPDYVAKGFVIDTVGPYTCVHWGRRDGGIWCERTK